MEVEFINKRKPVLTIYNNSEEITIHLADYDSSLEDLHTLMQSKGFIKKSSHDIQEIKNSKGVQYQEELERRRIMMEQRHRARDPPHERPHRRSEF